MRSGRDDSPPSSCRLAPVPPLEPVSGGMPVGQQVFLPGFALATTGDGSGPGRELPLAFCHVRALAGLERGLAGPFPVGGHDDPGFGAGSPALRIRTSLPASRRLEPSAAAGSPCVLSTIGRGTGPDRLPRIHGSRLRARSALPSTLRIPARSALRSPRPPARPHEAGTRDPATLRRHGWQRAGAGWGIRAFQARRGLARGLMQRRPARARRPPAGGTPRPWATSGARPARPAGTQARRAGRSRSRFHGRPARRPRGGAGA